MIKQLIIFTISFLIANANAENRCIPFYSGKSNEATNDWDMKIGKIWHSVVQKLDLPKDGVVVEIGPGGRAKIGHGLKAYGFKGIIYIIEPEPNVLANTVAIYRTLIPKATIIGISKPYQDAILDILHTPDAILANHLLDDVITHEGVNEEMRKLIFETCYTECSVNWVKKVWDHFILDPEQLKKTVHKVANQFVNFVASTKARSVGLSQYDSTYFQEMGVQLPDRYAKVALSIVKYKLQNHFQVLDMPEANTLNQKSDDWMLAR